MKLISQIPDMTDEYFEKNCLKCKFYYENEDSHCTYPDGCQKKTLSWEFGQIVAYIVLALIFVIACCAMYKIGQFFVHLF